MRKQLNNKIRYICIVLFMLCVWIGGPASAAGHAGESLPADAARQEQKGVNVKEIVFGHIEDAYEWHITTWGDTHVTVPLPIIVRGQSGEWNLFLSSAFHHSEGGSYKGFYISKEAPNEGKIVERDGATGAEIRPLNLSLSKTATGLLFGSIVLVTIILICARWSKRNPKKAPGGLIGFMEMFIMDIQDNVIKACIGPKYQKFSPYLLTAFFFIFFNNLIGLIPIFPGGANVTGNITITLVLALCTFAITNLFGTKEYYKDIFWPHVPLALKPIMIPIEIIGVFTKPFALMIRLFANIMAGHSIILCLVCIIFICGTMGAVMSTSMTLVSVLFSIFMNLLELLVSYIQAYVFTMLSAVFIGLAVTEPEHKTAHK